MYVTNLFNRPVNYVLHFVYMHYITRNHIRKQKLYFS